MEHPPFPLIRCYFTLNHLERELHRDQGWKPRLGTTSAEVVRAGIMRVAFLNALLGDVRVHACFEQLYEKAKMVSVSPQRLDEMARAHASPDEVDAYIKHSIRDQDAIMNDLQRFVEEALHCPPPAVHPSGLAMSLYCALLTHVSALLCGEPGPFAIQHVLSYSVLPAPQVHFIFDTQPGEGAWEALGRFEAEVSAWRKILTAPLRRGKPDRLRQDALEKYGQWLYRAYTCQETPYAIAKDYHGQRQQSERHTQTFPHCGCLKTVEKGLRKAEASLKSLIG